MEGLGIRLQQARAARGLSLEEAGRMTKIRPVKLAEIEAEDFSQFASLAYAKGFLLIYGKFLAVDVSPYLEAFETSEHVTVDGYSYLQDNPAPAPSRPVVVRKETASRGSLLPFIIGVIVLIFGFWVLKAVMTYQRIKPGTSGTTAANVPTPTASIADNIVAPRALPVESTPEPKASRKSAPTPVPMATAAPTVVATSSPAATPSATEPEVRRAEPVHAEDLVRSQASPSPTGSRAAASASKVEIRSLKRTYVKVVIDGNDETPAAERWLSPSDPPLKFSGQRIAVRVLDSKAVEIKKNGKKITSGDADVTVE